MQSHRFSTFARIVLVAVVAGAITACAPVRDYHEPGVYYSPRPLYYDYWYYPAIGSYYDPRTRIYIYFQHGHWIRARELPVRFRPYLGRYVTIRSSHERPYEEQLRHREQYAPERYRAKQADQLDHDVWIGVRNPPVRSREHDQRRTEPADRNRQDHDPRRQPERGAIQSAPPHGAPVTATEISRPAVKTPTEKRPGRRQPTGTNTVPVTPKIGRAPAPAALQAPGRDRDRDTGGERHRNDGRGDGRDPDARDKERNSSDEYGWRK